MTCSSLMPKSLGDVGPYYAHDPIQFEIETGFPQVSPDTSRRIRMAEKELHLDFVAQVQHLTCSSELRSGRHVRGIAL